ELVNNIQLFSPLAGYQKREYKEQDPVNLEAAEKMGRLHDLLKSIGYDGHNLELYLVRLLFCLFADDTGIFEKGLFLDFITLKTKPDGSDLAIHISQLFEVLNTPEDKRLKALDESVAAFPYINGKLFEESLPIAAFDSKMRGLLLDCCSLDWGRISPAIFGSLFQSVMDEKARRNLGAHYTSEKNIFKLIKPLFLDELTAEFESCGSDKNKLRKFHKKISELKFLDPACGCGNFLIITYRELRLLELNVVKKLLHNQQVTSVNDYFLIDVDKFYGIEYEEFPCQIAQVAMWLIDHQMNMLVSNEFGQYFIRLPLKKSANIVHGDALEINWEDLVSKNELSYIIGNPPFIGSKFMKQGQRDQIVNQFDNAKGSGVLDYVTGWYIKAAKYIQNTKIKAAFVSTNSIVQGEQTSILWGQMLYKYNIKIHFAHQTFSWSNEAKGNAGVHVIIIGFANFDTNIKSIFEYENIKGEPHEVRAKNINPYLVDAKDIFISKRTKPLCNVPTMQKGSQPTDNGNFLFTSDEKVEFIRQEPKSKIYFKRIIGSEEFINNKERWCLWLKDIAPNDLKKLPNVYERVENVRSFRLKSNKAATRKKAETPTLFDEIRQPESVYLAVPEVSSERRKYIPIGFMAKEVIASNKIQMVGNATLYHFGVLTSILHMTWTKNVCGRLESRYQYSASIVYNNFPWPENPSDKQVKAIETAAQKVLDTRLQFPNSSLADLYNPLTMPPALVKAHSELDRAVDQAYRSQAFTSETKRMEFLFELYEKYTANLFTTEKSKKRK
ncbi:MAG TPA: class I SAM-dependent DNA methyltransferase, partial [Candidatus Dojkabacteria bacterium]|nr:class I SAM-dependent DNA methyltransferase [Candidatus Dojkabacteria bacterium]